MARTPRIYEKLTRPKSGAASYSSLWLAGDHVMLVRSTGYSEQYQRFQFSDIQAFLVCASNRRQNWSIAWTVTGVLILIPLLWSLRENEFPFISLGLLLLVLLFLLINYLLGPTCTVSVVTRVQITAFPIVRKRKATKVLARLQPLIEAAQADLSPATEEMPLVPPPPLA